MSTSRDLSYDTVRGVFEHSADHVTELVQQIQQKHWGMPTPNPGMSVRDLVAHLTYELLWAPSVLAGATIEEVGDAFERDVLGKEPLRAWVDAEKAARAAVNAPDSDISARTVHLSYGDAPAADYVFELATDLLLHSWDLARAIGAPEALPATEVEVVWAENKDRGDEIQASGVFGPAVHVPDGVDLQTRLLALYGRAAEERAEP